MYPGVNFWRKSCTFMLSRQAWLRRAIFAEPRSPTGSSWDRTSVAVGTHNTRVRLSSPTAMIRHTVIPTLSRLKMCSVGPRLIYGNWHGVNPDGGCQLSSLQPLKVVCLTTPAWPLILSRCRRRGARTFFTLNNCAPKNFGTHSESCDTNQVSHQCLGNSRWCLLVSKIHGCVFTQICSDCYGCNPKKNVQLVTANKPVFGSSLANECAKSASPH